ncbi:MAG: hypothetical protein LBH11_06865 [Propionibacteriaceae bacterium]|jgi:N,N'-diacetylchitobiose phosphorylase|nr:hypothetical protein [Propionibacteriaceae bacterium]
MQYGHFDDAAQEYVIDRVDTPSSWINYLGVERWCTVINQSAGGYSFFRSPQSGRVTRFRPNGVPVDRPGHYLYLRDDSDGDYWSASWQPVGKPLRPFDAGNANPGEGAASYRTRHGLSYSVYESEYRGITASQRIFVPLGDDVELWDVSVSNNSAATRELSLFGYVEFSFHSVQIDNENFQMSLYAAGSSYAAAVIEYDFFYEPWTYHFFTATREPAGFDSLRDSFIGSYRDEGNPLAVERGECSNSQGATGNHCGALQHRVTLAPGETVRFTYLLGYGRREVGQRLRDKYADPAAVDSAIANLANYWQAKRAVLQVRTPDADLNTLINTWTLYQAETCAVWSRFASFVEVGGRVGLGYRDTSQDVMSVPHTNPDKVRQRLVELLHGQMSWGYGLHLFDPALFAGPRDDIPGGVKLPTVVPSRASDLVHGLDDACSDDHLWLVPSVVQYVVETGALCFLDEVIPFADSALNQSERSAVIGVEAANGYDPTPTTVYQHLLRAIEFTAAQVGENGIAKGLRADWNDCLNLGGGQSALVAFLHVWATRSLLGLVAQLPESDPRRADLPRLEAISIEVGTAIERELWDGAWYLRGFTSGGVPIGSNASPEGKVFLEHMPWAVISGVAVPERATQAMNAVHEHLASEYGAHLVWPAYTKVDDAIGYVTRVYPGVKENGAIFSHPNAWPVIAEALLGRGERAYGYYRALAPSRYNDRIEVRRTEPYVYAQFEYGRDHEFFGRAENPWLTGTAGWMYTAATQYLLGIRPTLTGLVVDPCIPPEWEGFEVTRVWRGATYRIKVENPRHVSCAASRPAAVLPVISAGETHSVTVVL